MQKPHSSHRVHALYAMQLDQLKAFLLLAQEHRFTAAAKKLGVSQSGLSRQLQGLEREVGTRLLVRTPGGVVLTEAGERFLPHARRTLDALEVGMAELGQLSNTPRGLVSLGTVHTVGAYLLPELLRDFRAQHPSVRIRVNEGMHDDLEGRVARGELDLAILQLPLRRLDLVAHKLWQEDLFLAVPRGHRLAQLKRPVALSETVDEPWITIPGVAGTLALEAACAERGQTPNLVIETDNAESLRRMVECGLGVALLPELIAGDRSNFDVVRISKGGVKRQVAVLHRGEGYLTAAARALKALIVAKLRKPAPPA